MKSYFAVAALVAVSAVVAGCTAGQRSGVVEGAAAPAIQGDAPDITFETAGGGEASFQRVRRPVALLAFTESPGAQCCWIEPRLLRNADALSDVPVTVAQVSLPTSHCEHGSGCSEACRLQDYRLLTLCDADRKAWNAYGRPAPGTVLLIDAENRIVADGRLTRMDPLVDKARELGERYYGIRSDREHIRNY